MIEKDAVFDEFDGVLGSAKRVVVNQTAELRFDTYDSSAISLAHTAILRRGMDGYPCRAMRFGSGNKPSAGTPFVQCAGCKKTLFAAEFEENQRVCPSCGHHHRLSAADRIRFTFDEDSFEERDAGLRSVDSLSFPEYHSKLTSAIQKTGLQDGVVDGLASLDQLRVSIAVADFAFMGGSMGSVAGEKVTRTLERASDERIAAIVFCASGGARMQEGLLSLMQMAKTTAAVERCRRTGTPFICVFTDPTMAGVLASYASIADVILAEPKALVGFAGARVSKQAQVGKVPDGFQTAEYVHAHGMIDRVVPRKEMRGVLSTLVRTLGWRLYGQ